MPGDVSVSAERVRLVREALGLTQAGFGSVLGVHGVTVCRWELGQGPMLDFEIGLLSHFETAAKCERASEVRNVLASDGPIAALHFLLCLSFDKADGKNTGRKSRRRRREGGPHAG